MHTAAARSPVTMPYSCVSSNDEMAAPKEPSSTPSVMNGQRMNQFVDRVELALRQSWKLATTQGGPPDSEAAARAGLVMAFVIGRWHRFAKSGFELKPSDGALLQLAMMVE